MEKLQKPYSPRVLWLLLLSVASASGVGTLAIAEDVGIAENTENSFRPERVIQVKVTKGERQPKGLKPVAWDDGTSKVVTRYFGSSSESVLSLQGRLEREDPSRWNAIWNEKSFDVGREGVFELKIPFDAGFKNLELALVGPKGEVEYHFYQLELEMPAIPVAGEIEAKESELPAGEFANYFIAPPKWDLGFTGFFNFVSLSRSSPVDVRFLGLNLRLGYIFPQVEAPWRLSLYGGWYYSTMFASDSSFGYKNISGPQLFPSLRRNLNSGHAVSAFLKFSPISNNFGFLSLSNHEFATGVSYLIPTETRTYSISVDYARISFSDEEVEISSNSISLGGSVTF